MIFTWFWTGFDWFKPRLWPTTQAARSEGIRPGWINSEALSLQPRFKKWEKVKLRVSGRRLLHSFLRVSGQNWVYPACTWVCPACAWVYPASKLSLSGLVLSVSSPWGYPASRLSVSGLGVKQFQEKGRKTLVFINFFVPAIEFIRPCGGKSDPILMTVVEFRWFL